MLYSCILKVGRWARNRRPRTALNCKRAFKQLRVEPWTARLEGAARGWSARRGPVGRGLEAGVRPSWALQSQGLGLGPRRTAGGAEAWPVAARGSGGGASLRGLGAAWPPPSARAGRTLGLRPSARRPLGGSRFSTPKLGGAGVLGPSRAEPPRRVNYSWGARAGSQDPLCPQLLRRSGEKAGEKFAEQSWPHFSFSQVSIEHLLDAWHLDWGCCQGLGRNVRASWALRVSAGNNA